MENPETDKNLTMNNPEHMVYFNTRDELTKVCLDDVMYVTNEGNYIVLKFKSGRSQMLLASLSNFEQVAQNVPNVHFERIGRSHIINIAYVSQINSLRKTIILVDDSMRESVEIIIPKEAIRNLKKILENVPHKSIPDFQTSNGNMEAFFPLDSQSNPEGS